jgi:hypothetical protein
MIGHFPAVKCEECGDIFLTDFRSGYSFHEGAEVMKRAVEMGWTFEGKGRTREYCPGCSRKRHLENEQRAIEWKKINGVL